MTREEIIGHLINVEKIVFYAEAVVLPQWEKQLQALSTADSKERKAIEDAYLRAIAEEIVNQYPEDQLQILYNS